MRLKIRKFLAALGVTLLGVVGTLAITETPASAHEEAGCIYGRLCTWTNEGYSGSMYYYTFSQGSGACVNIGSPFNNAISSVINNRPGSITLFDGYYCDGSAGVSPTTVTIDGTDGFWSHHQPTLNDYFMNWFNDRASSIRFN